MIVWLGLLAAFFPLCIFLGKAHASPSRKQPCKIEVSQVLEASVGRGPPYLVQILRQNPENADRIASESHGDYHLSCIYKVSVNSRPYRYKAEFANMLRDLKEEDCDAARMKKEIREEILRFTDRCRDPLAQPAWGHPLQLIDGL